jgi:hypothetical protein
MREKNIPFVFVNVNRFVLQKEQKLLSDAPNGQETSGCPLSIS